MKSKFIITLLLFQIILFYTGCEYEKIPKPIVPKNVSFKNDVMPIFNRSCNSVSCHAAGGVAPDLSPVNAWNSLTYGGYITDSVNIANNTLFQQINSKKMPPGGSLSAQDTTIIFTWIRKGFEDN
jgi:hypothetical protein